MHGDIKRLILVASGKGGVGKSTVACNLALALSKLGYQTGLLDADVYGPSIPTMFGPAEKPGSPDGKRIYPIEKFGLRMMSMGYLVDPNVAMVWRGPMLAGAVTQFVDDVDWGHLDYLIFDLPPGTGDVQLTLAQKFKVTGAVLVTTPQQVALSDVYRAKAMFDKVHIPILGLIENMSYFLCGTCNTKHSIFASGGGQRAAEAMEVPCLGCVPLETAVREAGDAGVPAVESMPHSETARIFMEIAQALHNKAEIIGAAQDKATARKQALRIVTH